MNEREMRDELQKLRDQWRSARDQKLLRKTELRRDGMDTHGVRHDREYRVHRKAQRSLSKLIRHLERRLNRQRVL